MPECKPKARASYEAAATNHHWFASKLRIQHLLYRDKESVKVNVHNGVFCHALTARSHG